MPNPHGNSASLEISRSGNQNRLVHGIYSARQGLSPRAKELADALLRLPHTGLADELAAEEIGALIETLERVDRALADGRVENRAGQVRTLVEVRRRLSAELRAWLGEFGLTPSSRAAWAAALARGEPLGHAIARRRREADAA